MQLKCVSAFSKSKVRPLYLLIFFLFLKSIVVFWWIQNSGIDLSADEAQYWCWSRQLDWGYYSKPPMIAWQIFLTCYAMGNTVLGIRLGAVILSFLMGLAIFFLARKCLLSSKESAITALVFSLTPIGFTSAWIATTDLGFVFFWVLASIYFIESMEGQAKKVKWIGFSIALGALYKWTIFLLWPCILIFLVLEKKKISKVDYAWSLLFSLLGLFPSFIWNVSHMWATFRHVFAQSTGGTHRADANFGAFFAAQVGILSPLLFFFFILSVFYGIKNWKIISKGLRFLTLSSSLVLVMMSIFSCFSKVQANWAVYAYPGAVVLLCFYVLHHKWYKGLIFGVLLSLSLLVLACSIFKIQERGLFPSLEIPYRINPFRHILGWRKLPKLLNEAGYNPKEHFLFSDRYQMTSLLSFYSQGQKQAYFFNMGASRQNQFSFWEQMSEKEVGKTAYFLVSENTPHWSLELAKRTKQSLEAYFERVELVREASLFDSYDRLSKGVFVFKCYRYNGLIPSVSKKTW